MGPPATAAHTAGDLAPAMAETHSGLVFFVGTRAYKLKKPVDLGFLDFRDRSAREAVCHREVELNRRLAPDVYLGVADVAGPDGEPCDHLVMMERLPADRRLATLVDTGADVDGHLDDVARLLAGFHAGAERGPLIDAAARADALLGRWEANTAELAPFAGRHVAADEVEAVDALARRYLAGRADLLDGRIAAGRACDGHGDLLADDIFCLDDGPRILDCIEFDDALRHGDVLADVAFLAMDLERLGRPDLAARFLAAYRHESGETWPGSLAHHHIAYRAQVRAKVAAIRADQGEAAKADEARSLLALARGHLEAGRVRLLLVGGLPGTGKSTLAAGLGAALEAVVLRTDEIRKELAGLSPDEPASAPFGTGLYTADAVAATYEEVLRRAGHLLRHGETVVLDASWTDAGRRDDARRLADATCSDLAELRCTTPPEVAADRLRARAAAGGDASDADPDIASTMAANADPWPRAVVIDTTAPPADAVQAALAAIDADGRRAPA